MGVGALLPMEQEPHDDEEEDGGLTHHQTTSTFIPPQAPIVQPIPLAQVEEDDQVLFMIIFKNKIIIKGKNKKVQSLMMNLNKYKMKKKIFHHT